MALTQVKTSGIADDAVTLAKQAGGTDGQVITYDASGNPVAVGPGTDGQVLTSTGAGSPPAFEDVPAGGATINNATENEIVTVASNTSQLDAEAKLTFDGNNLTQTTDADGEGIIISNSGNTYNGLTFDANRSAEGNPIGAFFAKWNGNVVGSMQFNAGADTTNKDDGYFDVRTAEGGTNTERLRIAQDGKVGINTTSPQYQFEVDTTTTEKTSVGLSANGESADIRFRSNNVNEAGVIRVDESGGGGIMRFHNKTTGGTLTQNLEIEADGDVKVNTGNLIIGTSGKGIDFSATANTTKTGASMDNELFDDYEKGTWTADLYYNWGLNAGFSTSPSHEVGTYVKIGDMVFAQCYVYNWTMNSGDGSAANIKGLPFISANVSNHFWLANITYSNAFDETDVHAGYLNKGDDNIRPTRSSGDSAPTWNSSSGRYFMLSVFYATA